jgi:hypothetical protein
MKLIAAEVAGKLCHLRLLFEIEYGLSVFASKRYMHTPFFINYSTND